ncbi:RyR domain-containing protein [Shewanella sp. 3_MG-2023]|uniref:NAD-binding protein n=1 Tax=Shewanella sp. 3_MG-2023 TaxID=3062635 RepID=UPI0026E16228|nr:NAD-binding protein [Shewanella sp. 3_MG-2023]MDO6774826.1 RyR domain-containing protein [Shewanella sp. 3_MG-2023]
MNDLPSSSTQKKSPSIVYTLLENKAITIAIVCISAFILRFVMDSPFPKGMTNSVGSALEFASIVSASVIAVLIYFKDAVNQQIVKRLLKREHITVFGLGEFNSALLSNEMAVNNNAYVIFEKSKQNDKLDLFRKFGMGVVEGDVFSDEKLEILNFDTMQSGVISLGNDRSNVELATLIIQLYKERVKKEIAEDKCIRPLKLVVHIINQDLNALFHQNFINPNNVENETLQLDIQTFSFYEEAAEAFFEGNFVDGEGREIIDSNDDYHIVVAGDGELALNIIYLTAKLAHLPNENKLTIHLVDVQASAFKEKVIKRYPGILNVLALEAVNCDCHTLSYFENDALWFKDNLTHVVVCYDDEGRNLSIAADLFNKTYLEKAVDETLKTRISFASFNNYNMSKIIDADKGSFKQFFTFADVKNICTRENVLDEQHELIAKLVNHQYAEEYLPTAQYNLSDLSTLDEINRKWYNTLKLSDKLSNKSQSLHIDMKLKALGFLKIKSDKTANDLLTLNLDLFHGALKSDRELLGLSNEFIQAYSLELPKLWQEGGEPINISYFPHEYSCMLEKLIRAEHNRWNAFHYLNGWKYNETKSKAKKQHDCLKPLSEFVKPEHKLTVIYDLYATLYIPNYLANAGYEIQLIK